VSDPTRPKRSRHTTAHGHLAALTKHRRPGDPELVAAQREVAEIKAERLIRDLVAQAPPISLDVRRRLAEILSGTADRADGAA